MSEPGLNSVHARAPISSRLAPAPRARRRALHGARSVTKSQLYPPDILRPFSIAGALAPVVPASDAAMLPSYSHYVTSKFALTSGVLGRREQRSNGRTPRAPAYPMGRRRATVPAALLAAAEDAATPQWPRDEGRALVLSHVKRRGGAGPREAQGDLHERSTGRTEQGAWHDAAHLCA